MRARTALKHRPHLPSDVCASPSRGRGVAPAATISQARLLCSSSFTAVSPVTWRPDRLGLPTRRKGCGVHATHASPVPGAVPR